MIKSINIESWRQFDNVQIDFHPRLTILTGANGAGKTTLLNIINQHFGWQNNLVGTAKRDKKTGGLKYLTGFWKSIFESNFSDSNNPNNPDRIGDLIYANGSRTNLLIPKKIDTTYQVQIQQQQPLKGFNIPSHRPIYKYQNVPNIKTSVITKRQAFQQYRKSQVKRYFGSHSDKTETYFIKETLISLAALGYGNQIVNANEGAIRIYEGFIEILRTVLPPKLGFKSLSVRIPEVVLETDSGEFSIDAVSGGIASIIDLAWQIYMFDESDQQFVVSFDEPENHLHPEMQKTLLPNFLKAFPNVQFIVASHNPFIISSVNDSNVYALVYNEENKVVSELLENVEKSGTANEILRQALGIETTTPEWVDDRIDDLLEKYSSAGITPENIQTFKHELTEIGLSNYINQAVVELISRKK
ncbi:putative AbiEii toxin of type IV toxin-antitoxin system [Roseivirga pacifica]|uniref:AAA domain-containing protein, putative AbiEii toxin, Type IV TA system n=1 Tax=Roseivirga pacifica TaxID=1267423 RepID=A0A1I0PXR4_9BACT|nr:AAA family ATPase [Roseivirga pacifica]RKQ43436.1 putative AbiEii toxin of type IV toxin-antitoxin system [Roseivirga pacifica]SEW19356.1 AAA domain-containing protein, putative AbiEii toxin, Type IV TA system [Roseivirga pacifica]